MLSELVLDVVDHVRQSFGVVTYLQFPGIRFQCGVDVIILVFEYPHVVFVVVWVGICSVLLVL